MQFVITAHDFGDPDALARRLEAREAHLLNMARLKANGNHIIGGALLDEKGTMVGSLIIVEFADRTALDLWLRDDPYVKEKVWEKIDIKPFQKAAVA